MRNLKETITDIVKQGQWGGRGFLWSLENVGALSFAS